MPRPTHLYGMEFNEVQKQIHLFNFTLRILFSLS